MSDTLDLAAFRGRTIEEHEIRPMVRWIQFGRFVLEFPKIWPPSPWRWPSEDLSTCQIDDWRVQHAVEILGSRRPEP